MNQSIREAAQILAEFAKTAPGRLPERVELAVKVVEANQPTFSLKSLESAVNGAILPGETAAEAIDRLASVAARFDKGVIVRAAANEDTLNTIRDVLGLEDEAVGSVVVERLLALLPQSGWTRGEKPDEWYRALGSGKRVAQVYRPYGDKWRRSSYLHGEHKGRYASAFEAMKAADAEAQGKTERVPPAERGVCGDACGFGNECGRLGCPECQQ